MFLALNKKPNEHKCTRSHISIAYSSRMSELSTNAVLGQSKVSSNMGIAFSKKANNDMSNLRLAAQNITEFTGDYQ
jgi:hypothetical protein